MYVVHLTYSIWLKQKQTVREMYLLCELDSEFQSDTIGWKLHVFIAALLYLYMPDFFYCCFGTQFIIFMTSI